MNNKVGSIYVVGANGQLGSEIRAYAAQSSRENVNFFSREEIDIGKLNEIKSKLSPGQYDVIINAAAYTDVDRAEQELEQANEANYIGPKNLASIARESGCLLIHISTDYVFDGNLPRPYKEDDTPAPLGVYGSSKLKGEEAILEAEARAIILRTSWVYSSFGKNFVKTILRLARERERLSVIFEQTGSPTYAADLAQAIFEVIEKIPPELPLPQIYNYSNEGVISWYDFAKAITELSDIPCRIDPIETKDYPLPAKRPVNSALNKNKIKRDFSLEIPYWRDSLAKCLGLINLDNSTNE